MALEARRGGAYDLTPRRPFRARGSRARAGARAAEAQRDSNAPTISPSGRHLRAQCGWTQWLSVTWRVLVGQQTCVTVGRCAAGWLHTC